VSSTLKARTHAVVDVRTPPHSVEAEQSVLGGLLIEAHAWDNVGDVVRSEDFYRPDHRTIFEALATLAAEGKPLDVITVSEALERAGKLETVGGLAYLGTLARDTPTAANIRAYADIVRERSLLRQLIQTGTNIAASVFNNEGETAKDLVERAEQQIFEIAEQGTRRASPMVAARDLLPALIDRIDEWNRNPDSLRGLPTGFIDFDRKTGGLRGGDLIIVAGRPSMGKTTLAVNMAENAALDPKVAASVLVFSMEMPAEQLLMRMMSSLGRVPLNSIRNGRMSDDDWVRLTGATQQLGGAKVFIDETPALTPTELRARARRIKREHNLNLVVVDYLQLMQVPGTQENRATEIGEISRGLKALAKELNVPVIALSQLNRGVEQRVEKRPVMSDLRECVTGDTRVWLTDGRRVPIRDLVGTEPEVWSIDEHQCVTRARSDKVWHVGQKAVFSVQLASGRSIRATAEHRLMSGDGWKAVADLAVGDRLALARQIPEPTVTSSWPDHWLVLLGHLAGDGSYLRNQPLRYATASEENSAAVRAAAEAFGSTVKRYAGRGKWHQLLISGNGNRWHAAGVGAWLKDLGIFGQRSHEKRLPEAVFSLPNSQLACLLRHLWATDGSIVVRPAGSRGGHRVYFCSCSEILAKDVAALLLRLGIVTRLRLVPEKKGRPTWTVDVSGSDAQQRFLDTVGSFGPRAGPALALATRLRSMAASTNVDTLPNAVGAEVRALMREQGISQRAMAEMRGTAYGGSSHFHFAFSRRVAGHYAHLRRSRALAKWSESDLFWDRVVEIVADGVEDVYDLTVPGPANWVTGDGLVTHNSGALEQDADMILLIYREEVYDKNTAKKGMAEVDLAKHRNGETGTMLLTFRGEITKFENYQDPAYAEGILR
jgi:replicative DNA helicase